MAKCPNCQKEVSFWRASSFLKRWDIWRENFWRGDFYLIYICNNCKSEFSITILSNIIFLLFIVAYAFILPFIGYLADNLESFLKIKIPNNAGVILVLLPLILICYIWWRYLAELREPYE